MADERSSPASEAAPEGEHVTKASTEPAQAWQAQPRKMSFTQMTAESLTAGLEKATEKVTEAAHEQATIDDERSFFPVFLILAAAAIAVCCGSAAFLLHLAVGYAGCFGGVNGCHDHMLLDVLKPYLGTSGYFLISCSLSGFVCSHILYSSFQGGVAKQCKGGGTGHTKIVVASGKNSSAWIVVFRILLSSIYMGGGNPLGTEGPIIQLSVALATSLTACAGFNVLITGFVYVIEELTRTLSKKLALILALAAAVAVLLKEYLELLLDTLLYPHHPPHPKLVPGKEVWESLSFDEVQTMSGLSLLIGLAAGVTGWVFSNCTFSLLTYLNPALLGRTPSRLQAAVPEKLHLAIIGLAVGGLGALCYEVTGMNGVWGTNVGSIPEAIKKEMSGSHMLILFATKFAAFVLATAAGGPGGMLVPSLVTGGFLALALARSLEAPSEALLSACAVIGMGSMFASIMDLPLTGVILMFELTRSEQLILPVILASFVASNVHSRLPHGEHSFVHRCLDLDPTWSKLHHVDFIETDEQEQMANLALFDGLKSVFMPDSERIKVAFFGWRAVALLKDDGGEASCELGVRGISKASNRSCIRSQTLPGFDLPGAVWEASKSSSDAFSDSSDSGEEIWDPWAPKKKVRIQSKQRPALATPKSVNVGVAPRKPIIKKVVKAINVKVNTMTTPKAKVMSVKVKAPLPGQTEMAPPAAPPPPATPPQGPAVVLSVDREPGKARANDTDGHPFLVQEKSSFDIAFEQDQQERKKKIRSEWDLLDALIPDMTVSLWRTLTASQRVALAAAAQKLGLSKSQKLDPDGGSSCDSGEAFERKKKRSCTVPITALPQDSLPHGSDEFEDVE
eukprot:TRINITY_DN14925_c0_g1_i2.p1 TRINITY_DN14925_c0_g1~~TRINITY_DN14925_c0_g1_i2.p1  ORF type:complete len:858 (+),score=176.95 TRINITY_DN14925_c0_g1_i2:25-2574(+)